MFEKLGVKSTVSPIRFICIPKCCIPKCIQKKIKELEGKNRDLQFTISRLDSAITNLKLDHEAETRKIIEKYETKTQKLLDKMQKMEKDYKERITRLKWFIKINIDKIRQMLYI